MESRISDSASDWSAGSIKLRWLRMTVDDAWEHVIVISCRPPHVSCQFRYAAALHHSSCDEVEVSITQEPTKIFGFTPSCTVGPERGLCLRFKLTLFSHSRDYAVSALSISFSKSKP